MQEVGPFGAVSEVLIYLSRIQSRETLPGAMGLTDQIDLFPYCCLYGLETIGHCCLSKGESQLHRCSAPSR